jgi:hypothetical protein
MSSIPGAPEVVYTFSSQSILDINRIRFWNKKVRFNDVMGEVQFHYNQKMNLNIVSNIFFQIYILFYISDQNSTYEPTQEEQADLELALEAVDEQLKRMQQADSTTDFLGEFLANVDDLCSSEEVTTTTTSNSGLMT